jgi:hypothetical protein
MAYLYARVFFNFDLKFGDILINERFEPIIGDFTLYRPYVGGIAFSVRSEVMDDDFDAYGLSIAVFSFAVTIYQAFVDANTFSDGRTTNNAYSISQSVFKFLRFVKRPEIPEYHWGVKVRSWEHDPQQRPTFQSLLEEFHDTHEYIQSEADRSAVLAHDNQIGTFLGAPSTRAWNARVWMITPKAQ